MRKLASVRRIDAIQPIPGADAIECAIVGGWSVVVKRGEFEAGDLAVYCEIDSWIPHELAPFLSKGQEPREYNGVKGERLRTVKLRGQLSQGLLLPLNDLLKMQYDSSPVVEEGDDVSEVLGIQKWEAPVPAQLAGDVRGAFPSFVPKTDQERIQNIDYNDVADRTWEVTEKLDGSSMTVYFKDGDFGVCSRNWNLRESAGNSLWQQARKYDLETVLVREGNYAVQGELIGEGIQGNPYRIKGQDFFVYDVYDINQQCYLSPAERRAFVERNNLKSVPVIDAGRQTPSSIAEILKDAEAPSVLNVKAEREGLVYKTGLQSFKAISNRFLLKGN
jgi:RNA ligase (TIGR02306 family)